MKNKDQLPPVLPGERNNIHPYERIARPNLLNDAILLFGGESLLVRSPFRWILNGRVVSNAYESHSMESVCTERGWKIEARFGDDIAIISGAEPPIALANGIGVETSDRVEVPEGTIYRGRLSDFSGLLYGYTSDDGGDSWSGPSGYTGMKGVPNSITGSYHFASTSDNEPLPSSLVSEPTSDPCESEAKPEAEVSKGESVDQLHKRLQREKRTYAPSEMWGRAQKLERQLAAANSESEKWRFKFLTQRDEANSNTWVWIGDGEDHPESLACPVIMAPDQLREFVAAKGELSQANAAVGMLSEALEIHVGKKAPVQGFAPGIPWDMHMEAYAAYCKKYSPQPALIEGWCRGGFGDSELDMFIPGWRDEIKRRHEQSRLASMPATPPAPDGWREISEADTKSIVDCHNGETRFTNCRYLDGKWKFRASDNAYYDTMATHFMDIPKPPSGKGEA